MADWLLNAARKLNLDKASLNILTATFEPVELNTSPLIHNARSLKEIIDKELLAIGFEKGFIAEAHIDFQFLNPNIFRKGIYCFPYLIDKEGRRYDSGRIIAESYEPEFDAFENRNINSAKFSATLLDKWKGLFK
ncbi:hypothetical protein CDA63_15090 [Hymenobacter amundsenii]|uniref:Uncharacterized protein n=1 Tax=Hymenobacter amundsenii TaxID=2006685 RepID=A0A246FI83_9BACT|nr:hypothetical protein [Hymenobacter amundsenii]OWP62229.1 hypothetical protein CDA63_15090 [Hymenobacter amundsenii]